MTEKTPTKANNRWSMRVLGLTMLLVGLLFLLLAVLLYYGAALHEEWSDILVSFVIGIIAIALIVTGFVLAILASKKARKPNPLGEPHQE